MAPPRYAPSGPHQRTAATKQGQIPALTRMPDNAGTVAWRSNEEHKAEVRLPSKISIDGARTSRIAADTSTHIALVTTPRRVYQIWGEPQHVAHAKSLLENVLADSTNFREGKADWKWAKTPSRTAEVRRIYEKELDTEELKQVFRRDPHVEAVFESIGSFVWPQDGDRPQEVFGSNCEALDPIRVDCSCYIVYNNMSGSFRAMGRKANVQEALVRLRASFYQLMARKSVSSKTYFLHWKDAGRHHKFVKVESYVHPRILKDGRLISPPRGGSPRSYGPVSGAELQQQQSDEKHISMVAKKAKDQIMQTLNKIKYYRGSLALRVRLGTLILLNRLESGLGEGCPIAKFETMMSRGEVECSITQELGNESLEDSARERLMQAEGFLETQSTFVHQLSDVEPVYTATLTLDPNDNVGCLQLSKSWAKANGDLVETSGSSWYRLEKGASEAKPLMETCVVDIEDGLSWQFEMLASTPIASETLSTFLQHLGTYHFNISEKEAEDITKHNQWCVFEKNERGHPRLVPRKKALDLRTTWQFGIAHSDYTVEVAKTMHFTYGQSSIPGKEDMAVYEPRWTIHVVHKRWAVNLAENSNLGVGKAATWRADLETWFPMDDSVNQDDPGSRADGHIEMMRKLFKVQAIIRGA